MTRIRDSFHDEVDISPRTPTAPVWPPNNFLTIPGEMSRSPRNLSPARSERSHRTLGRRPSDETIMDIYNSYERHSSYRPHRISWHQQRPSETTIAVDGFETSCGRSSRASSFTIMTVVDEYGSSTSHFEKGLEKGLEKGKGMTEVPIFDAAYSPIEWHYLSFDTREPELISFPPEYLRPPDLKKYTSPRNWSYTRKMLVTIVSSWATCLAADAGGSYNSPSNILMKQWGVSETIYELGLTIFCFGFALAPMVLAPLSEITGRRPLFIASGSILTFASVGCGFANSYATMLVGRLFAGIGASTFASVVGGVIGDMYSPTDRNTPMAIFSAGALMGTGIGPLFTNFVVANVSWRWVFWSQAIAVGLTVLYLLAFFPETRASVLLSAKAKILNNYYEKLERIGIWGVKIHPSPENIETHSRILRLRFKTFGDEERESLGKMITVSCVRPFHMLGTEPVVFFFSLWVAFAWGVLYIQFGAIPLVFKKVYSFNAWQCGLVFSSICAGTFIGFVASIFQERLLRKYWPQRAKCAEGRLYWSCIQSIFLPIGLFWFGWSAKTSISWWSPVLAIGLASIGVFSIYLACFNFLTDAYHVYASSALAAQSGCRNVMGGIFPLVTTMMFNKMGIAQASSLLGVFGALLTLVPWALVFYGPAIRAKSKMAVKGNPP